MPNPYARKPDNDEQQPGRWGSNRFIIILLMIVLLVIAFNVTRPSGDNNQVQTPSGTSRNQPADSPQP